MNCPICNSDKHTLHIRPYHWRKTKKEFSVVQCENCNTLYTLDAPSEENIAPYYDSETYISHTDAKKSMFDKVYGVVKQYMLGQKWKWMKPFVPRGTLIDYGAGSGAFVDFLHKIKRDAKGYELSEAARENGKKLYGVEIEPPEKIHQLDDNSIAGISLWHVLEHLYDPIEKIKMFHGKLCVKGALIIAVPNPESKDAKYYKSHWAAWDVPIHISHFPPSVIISEIEKIGFTFVQKRGMPFDAFYVSLISNENAYGAKKSLLAFWKGLQSNFYGIKTGNYSSMVYIFTKN
ncbi:MAG: class I SAM-dependent methyltransferase [Cryomorphaceae bacterium]|nr:class I SAM-dependent methyltransferase [Cryomorphaceae bacterium]